MLCNFEGAILRNNKADLLDLQIPHPDWEANF